MGETRRKFDKDFGEGAVRLVWETGKPFAQMAREQGTNEGMPGRGPGCPELRSFGLSRQPYQPRPRPRTRRSPRKGT
jgi:hypothetical protein